MILYCTNLTVSAGFGGLVICTYTTFFWAKNLFSATAIPYLESTREKTVFYFLPINRKF